MATAGYERARRALSPEDVVLQALEITHPDVPDPIRVVNDAVDQVLGGNTYVGLRFQAKLADDAERPPRAELTMDNVGRPLTQWLERAGGGAGAAVRVMEWLPGGAAPEWEVTVELASVHVDQTVVRATIGYEPLLVRRAVRLGHDPETSPGLF